MQYFIFFICASLYFKVFTSHMYCLCINTMLFFVCLLLKIVQALNLECLSSGPWFWFWPNMVILGKLFSSVSLALLNSELALITGHFHRVTERIREIKNAKYLTKSLLSSHDLINVNYYYYAQMSPVNIWM